MRRTLMGLACVAMLGAAVALSCGYGDDDDEDGGAVADATPTAAGGDETPTEAPTSEGGGETPTNPAPDGAEDVRGQDSVTMAAENFAFSPAALRGEPGQALTIEVTNSSGTPHNFLLEAQGIDTDVPDGSSAEIEVTFPESGSLTFVCKFHTGQGMEGQLLAGDAQASTTGGSDGGGNFPY